MTDTDMEKAYKIYLRDMPIPDTAKSLLLATGPSPQFIAGHTAAQSQSAIEDDKLAFQTALANGLMNEATDYSMSLDDHAKMYIAFQAGRDSKAGKSQSGWVKLSDYKGQCPVLLLSNNDARQYFDECIPVDDAERMEFFEDVTHFLDLSDLPPQPPEGG